MNISTKEGRQIGMYLGNSVNARKKEEKNWLTLMGIYEQELIQQRS